MQRIMLKSKIHRATVTAEAALKHEPKLVFVDEYTGMLPTRKEDAGQSKLKCMH